MTTPSLYRQIWTQTWPMALGVTALLGFYLIDSLFIARLGTAPLAAQSFTFPLTFLVIGLQVGIGIALAALISRAIGAGDQDRANRLGALVLTGGGVLMALVALLLWLLQTPAFTLLGADSTIRALIRPYWAVQVPAIWLSSMVYFGYSLFRAHGNTQVPGFIMILTSLFNLMLDPLLIFGLGPVPALGLAGAAWATLLSFLLSGAILVVLLRGRNWVQRAGLIAEFRLSTRPFLGIAGPAMISQLMPPLAAMLATALVARGGAEAVAAWGLASRIESVSLVLVLGMTMALPPWLGRCYGGNDWAQIRALMRAAAQLLLAWQLLLGLALAVFAAPLARLLVDSPVVQTYLIQLLRWLPPSYGLLGICMLVVSASNALGWPLRAMLISFLRLFVCYLPLLWLGLQLAGFSGLAIGAACGNLLAGTLAWLSYRKAVQNQRSVKL